ARNIHDPPQLQALTEALRRALPNGAVLMVDQEGGRVARLRPPHWRAHPAAAVLGRLFTRHSAHGLRAAFLTGALIGLDCASAGFDVAAALLAAGVQPVGKHAPGHGRALVDSHLALPRVHTVDLRADLLPFASNA